MPRFSPRLFAVLAVCGALSLNAPAAERTSQSTRHSPPTRPACTKLEELILSTTITDQPVGEQVRSRPDSKSLPRLGPAPAYVDPPEVKVDLRDNRQGKTADASKSAEAIAPPPRKKASESWKPTSRLRIDPRIIGSTPEDQSGAFFGETIAAKDQEKIRRWAPTVSHWQASRLQHRPLYFEDPALERCGHSSNPRLQPVLSGVRFFGGVPTLPLRVLQTPPRTLVRD